jgi:hypothetical protein
VSAEVERVKERGMEREEKLRCKEEFDDFLKLTTKWIDLQKEMLETKPTPEKIEEITRLYNEVIRKAKEFSSCEVGG